VLLTLNVVYGTVITLQVRHWLCPRIHLEFHETPRVHGTDSTDRGREAVKCANENPLQCRTMNDSNDCCNGAGVSSTIKRYHARKYVSACDHGGNCSNIIRLLELLRPRSINSPSLTSLRLARQRYAQCYPTITRMHLSPIRPTLGHPSTRSFVRSSHAMQRGCRSPPNPHNVSLGRRHSVRIRAARDLAPR
jgi:hypothetical protein